MPAEVVGQVPVGRESPAAPSECALEGLLSVVDAHVRLEVALLCEALAAAREVALEGFLAHVSPFVDLQAARSRVFLIADVTYERLVSSVDQLMCFEMAFGNKAFIALCELTGKWSLSGVNSEMRLQVASLLEISQALDERAIEGLLGAAGTLRLLICLLDLKTLALEMAKHLFPGRAPSGRTTINALF